MAGTDIKLPGIGTLPRRQVYIAVGVVAVIGGTAYYRKRKAASAAAASASTGTAAIDPQTSYPEGSPEDLAALAALAASAGTGGSYGGGSGVITTPTPVPGTGLTTNAQWEQAALDYLVNTVQQSDAGTISAALGAYLAGDPLTTAQVSIVEQANASQGQPPVAAPDGYPPHLRPLPAGSTTGGGMQLKVGEVLRIPYDVAPGQAGNVARKFGISLQHLLNENPGKTGHETSVVEYLVPVQVSASMTLASLARDFGISIEHLQQYIPAS